MWWRSLQTLLYLTAYSWDNTAQFKWDCTVGNTTPLNYYRVNTCNCSKIRSDHIQASPFFKKVLWWPVVWHHVLRILRVMHIHLCTIVVHDHDYCTYTGLCQYLLLQTTLRADVQRRTQTDVIFGILGRVVSELLLASVQVEKDHFCPYIFRDFPSIVCVYHH